jgi:hypothetical protein
VTLPDAIKVGHLDYVVEAWPAREANSNDRIGECDRNNLVIRVREDLPPRLMAECLLHEVCHAVFDNGTLQDGDSEERVVSAMARGLSQVWRDNPGFVAFMTGALV